MNDPPDYGFDRMVYAALGYYRYATYTTSQGCQSYIALALTAAMNRGDLSYPLYCLIGFLEVDRCLCDIVDRQARLTQRVLNT